MKIRFLLFTLAGMLMLTPLWATQHTITNSGFNFVPAVINVTVGDTVVFDIDGSHNAIEVSKENYDARQATSNAGFTIPFGGGSFVVTEAKTYYYVCQPHVSLDMVGTIVASAPLDENTFVAHLSGSNEVLPVLSGGSGTVTATLDGTSLTLEGSFSGLSSDFNPDIGAHIHLGYAGQNGDVEIPLVPTVGDDNRSGTFEADDNTFTLDEGQINALRNRQMYVNIHTVGVPSGEIRGQLLNDANAYYGANLFGSNEAPSVISEGAGALALEVIGDSLYVSGAFSGLGGELATDINGGAHLHIGMAGENGGVEFPLTASLDDGNTSGIFTAADNAFALTEDHKTMLANRMFYANLHSTVYRSGELRGQIRGMADAVFRAHLSGNNEVPPVTSTATGAVLLELEENTLRVSGVFSGMSDDLATDLNGGAHLHLNFAGRNGGVDFPLVVTQAGDAASGRFMIADNEFTLTNDQRMALMNRGYYVNIHSLTNPGGELRGQVLPESQYFFNAFLTGMQQGDPVLSMGSGAVVGEIMGNNLTLTGSFNNMNGSLATEIRNGSHIHLGLAGTNGPIQYELMATQDDDPTSGLYMASDNTFEVLDPLKDLLKQRWFYVNVHSSEHGSGELRGQLLHEATAYFYAPLSASSEAPPARSGASGALILEWNAGSLLSSGAFAGLESDFNSAIVGGAHIHLGYPGQNGGIWKPLTTDVGSDNKSGAFRLASNTFEVSEAFPDTITDRRYYVNIHSTDIPSGELRGQILPFANAYFTTTLSGINEVQPVTSSGSGAFKFELNGNRLSATGSFMDLDGDFDPSIAGGSHLHFGMVGENGGIDTALTVMLAGDAKSGIYRAAENSFPLTESDKTALMTGGYYVNIHTTAVGSGEIRGQVLPETNQFPDTSSINGPASGAMVELSGLGDTEFQATWSPAEDPDGNNLAYIWQLATDLAFENTVLATYTGADTAFVSDFATVSALLMSVGVEVGQTVKLYHRVTTTDGSLQTVGLADSVSITLGEVTDVDDAVIEQMAVTTYPNPASNQLQVNIKSVEALNGVLVMVDELGRVMRQQKLQLNTGENRETLNIQSFDSGLYFVQFWVENKLAGVQRVLIQR